jgi:hypothetical protein
MSGIAVKIAVNRCLLTCENKSTEVRSGMRDRAASLRLIDDIAIKDETPETMSRAISLA